MSNLVEELSARVKILSAEDRARIKGVVSPANPWPG